MTYLRFLASRQPRLPHQASTRLYSSHSAQPKDFYHLLGVPRNSSQDEIKRAYRTKTKKLHPDVNPDPNAAKQFAEINQAYDTLKDPQKRSMYDMTGAPNGSSAANAGSNPFGFRNMAQNPFTGQDGANPFGQGGNMNFDPNMKMDFNQFEEIFEKMTKRGGPVGDKAKRNFGPVKGNDVHFKLNISFAESIRGATKEIAYNSTQLCGSCHGSASKDGEKRMKCAYCEGKGKTVMSTGFFHLQQDCTHCDGLGERFRASCPDCEGRGTVKASVEHRIPVPQGVETGDRLKVTGKGEVGVRGGQSGNLFVEILVHDEKSTVFLRKGIDLHIIVPVPVTTAILGGVVHIPNLDAANVTAPFSENAEDEQQKPRHLVEIQVKPNTQQGDKLILKNKGVTKVRNVEGVRKKVTGDMVVHFSVVMPQKLTENQRERFTEFAKAMEVEQEEATGDAQTNFSRYPTGLMNYKLFRYFRDKCKSWVSS